MRNLTNKTLEGKLSDEKLGGLLIATNLAEGDSSGTEAMGLLHTTRDGLPEMTQYSETHGGKKKLLLRQQFYALQTLQRAAYGVPCL